MPNHTQDNTTFLQGYHSPNSLFDFLYNSTFGKDNTVVLHTIILIIRHGQDGARAKESSK